MSLALRRALALLPLPYLAALCVLKADAVLAAWPLASALALWSRRPWLRLSACASYAICLALGFGVGAVAAVLDAFGGLQGEPAGPAWRAIAVGTGALVSALALLPLVALAVSDLKPDGGA